MCLTGCARSEIASGSIIYNKALGTAENRLLLLNVVRASRGDPMYFTQISKLTTSGVADGSSLKLRIPYGAASAGAGRVIPDLVLQEGIQMDTAPLLGQELLSRLCEAGEQGGNAVSPAIRAVPHAGLHVDDPADRYRAG